MNPEQENAELRGYLRELLGDIMWERLAMIVVASLIKEWLKSDESTPVVAELVKAAEAGKVEKVLESESFVQALANGVVRLLRGAK